MDRIFLSIGSLSACLGVIAGAFGSHALKSRLDPSMLNVYETGVRYQMYHALGLIAVAWVQTRWPGRSAVAAGWLFVSGTLVFSGSLYALSLTGVRGFGAVTPLGGLALLAGWICLARAPWRDGTRSRPSAPR